MDVGLGNSEESRRSHGPRDGGIAGYVGREPSDL